ncbi:MAG: CBS domain-containing protein [Chloroflexota bacterium]
MQVITTHDNADFDGVAAMLAASRLYPGATPVLPRRIGRNVRQFLTLYSSALPFVNWQDFRPRRIDQVVLVDTQRVPDLRKLRKSTPILVIDHHPFEDTPGPHTTLTGEVVGATTTLLVEKLQSRPDVSISSLEATLMLLGIYSDTGSLTYGTTTPRDVRAAAWLLEQHAAIDTVRRFLVPPLGDDQREVLEMAVDAIQDRSVQGYTVTISAVSIDRYVENVNSVAHRLRDMLEPDALFLLVEMHDSKGVPNVQMVCRSRSDAVDVGAVARHFGGGGHTRAAAANISGRALNVLVDSLWHVLETSVRPAVRVADLMSHGVQTVSADSRLKDIITQLRRIGHEGYPVLEGERVVGLLTRRDADRALEHGLKDTTVREIMDAGQVMLTPDDSVSKLEQVMVNSDWGQIPVVDEKQHLIGIVTRTDLIKYWAKVHPAAPTPEDHVERETLASVLGDPVAKLIDRIASHAQAQHLNVYIVGGVVRDLLLDRRNDDIDFVVEGDAIAFARSLAEQYGGEINSYRPFGTATWHIDAQVARTLNGGGAKGLPPHIDFATARNEFYEHPTALPSVYSGSIKLDLHRRDFTINTLAIQLSPAASMRLLDFYGGLNDLRERRIRVLHSLSFVDDPTRVLRAVRFEHRLGFAIEPRTAELIQNAWPMLRRITGERLRNEFKLLLHEADPEWALVVLQQRGILEAIHPDFRFEARSAEDFAEARHTQPDWPVQPSKLRHLYWHLWLGRLSPLELPDLGARLLFSKNVIRSCVETARLTADPGVLNEPDAPPSAITRLLDGLRDNALLALWVMGDTLQRDRLQQYITTWRDLRSHTNGETLKAMGLPPGPRYRVILDALRDAWLDGRVTDEARERALLRQLIEETEHDGT